MADQKEHPSAQGLLAGIGRNVTILGSIVAGVVAINTALSTCSTQTVSRHQTFRQAVDGEEQYWRSLYSDYLGAFGKNVELPEREARGSSRCACWQIAMSRHSASIRWAILTMALRRKRRASASIR